MLRLFLFTAVLFFIANTSFANHGIKAINGHTIELNGDLMIVQGVICPSIETPEGMDAKRLANTYVHGRNVTCEVISNFGAAWRGDCKLKSNNGNEEIAREIFQKAKSLGITKKSLERVLRNSEKTAEFISSLSELGDIN